jgi:hypothetical protein
VPSRTRHLGKKEDVTDQRVSLLSLTRKRERVVDEVVEEVRPIDDMFFGTLERGDSAALAGRQPRTVWGEP